MNRIIVLLVLLSPALMLGSCGSQGKMVQSEASVRKPSEVKHEPLTVAAVMGRWLSMDDGCDSFRDVEFVRSGLIFREPYDPALHMSPDAAGQISAHVDTLYKSNETGDLVIEAKNDQSKGSIVLSQGDDGKLNLTVNERDNIKTCTLAKYKSA